MLQKLSFTFHHYQFIAKKNLSGYNADKTEPIGKGKIIIYAKRRKLTQKSHGPDG